MTYPSRSKNTQSMVNTSGKDVPSAALQFLDNIAFVDSFGQSVVAEMRTNISVNWAYGILDETYDVVLPTPTGDGVQSAVNGYASVSSAASGSATIDSLNQLRYVNGCGFFALFTSAFVGVTGNGSAGPHDDNDGFRLNYDADTDVMTFEYLENGVPKDTITIDQSIIEGGREKLNIFAVLGGFLGVADPILLVREHGWKVLGVIKTEGVLDEPHVRLPAFPMRIRAENGMEVRSGSWRAGTIGDDNGAQDRGFVFPSVPFGAAGNDPVATPGQVVGRVQMPATAIPRTLAIVKIKDTFNGFQNKIKVQLARFEFSVAPINVSGTVQVQFVVNPTITGANYTDVNTVSSVVQIDSNAGLSATGLVSTDGRVLGVPININYSGSGGGQGVRVGGVQSVDVSSLDFTVRAGDEIAIVARDLNGNSVLLDYSLNWVEKQL